ncbi:MAG: aldehyde dehydrogenase family protein, partial [Alcaligenaceae bacterium]|nr:aldehyde dehydrogenase family protein [Alcaligenaceae bacterium]
ALIEINDIAELEREVFGPVLHVVRFKRENLDALVEAINHTGYGLTFGIHSRIDETISHISNRIHAGNIYVNRNIVGAVVGVQPFGGQGLSGTGPKAGGPLYLFRLLSQGNDQLPAPFNPAEPASLTLTLPGPTGETNVYRLVPRGTVLAFAQTEQGFTTQLHQITATGNRALFIDSSNTRPWLDKAEAGLREQASLIADTQIDEAGFDAVLFEGDSDGLRNLNLRLSQRKGPIMIAYGLSLEEIIQGKQYPWLGLVHEQSISTNTAAAGGNASLMTIG